MSLLKELNPVQQEAVKAANGPVMIIAGAGSGKTRVLTYRIAYLVQCGVPAYQILALTFTNKAAKEMKDRITRLVGDTARELWMGTFHSIFARLLRRECQHLGYTSSFTIYDAEDSLDVIKRAMTKLHLSLQQFNPSAIRARISGAKNQLISESEFTDSARDLFDEKAALIYAEYQKILKNCNAMDFDDLLLKPIELFERKPEILERYQHRFKFVLLDEFQDTNRAQYKVTRLIGGKHQNVCVVGDDAQSIYSFRGADIRNILDFERDYPQCKTFRLEQNYRSTKSILSMAGNLIRFNQNQLKKNLWTDNPEGEPVRVVRCADDMDEGYQIVQLVQEESSKNKLDLKDFAVLYRTNAQSRALEDALRRSGIPYVIVGGIRFYERKEIKDILAYLRILTNPQDEESLLRVINYPSRGIGDTTVDRLRNSGLSLLDALANVDSIQDVTDRAKKGVRQFRAIIEKYRELRSKMSLSELARSLVDELGILTMFKEERTPESMNRWENVQELLSAISEFSHNKTDATLEAFLEEVALVSDIDSWEGTSNAVTLMTLHSSKGLEFPVVMIVGLEEGLLPFYSSTIDKPDLEEERRLFYVGITRAQRTLYLTHAKLRFRFGDATYPGESRFLAEIGTENIELLSSRGARKSLQNGFVPRLPRVLAETQSYFRDPIPDYESESQESFEVKRGSIVLHEMFGKGKVVEVSGRGEDKKAVVNFEQYGTKNLILKFARLRPA